MHAEHFQKRMSSILAGLDGVVCLIDDILVFGRSQSEHDNCLQYTLERIQNSGVTLNVCSHRTQSSFLVK